MPDVFLTESFTVNIPNVYQHSKHGSGYLAILCLLTSVDIWGDSKENDLEGRRSFRTLLLCIDVDKK